MKFYLLPLMLFSAISISSMPSKTKTLEHAECLISFIESDLPAEFTKPVNFNQCKEKWKWTHEGEWVYCKKKDFAYSIEFNKENLYIINMYYNSEGSGVFSRLVLIEKRESEFKLIEGIGGGDRCQHGLKINKVIFKDGLLFYSESITPAHLMNWNDTTGTAAIEYADCMVCCCGSARYTYDPVSRKKVFVGIQLESEAIEEEDSFSKTFNRYVKQGKTLLNEQEIVEFIKEVKGK